jgi:hypothetical protein
MRAFPPLVSLALSSLIFLGVRAVFFPVRAMFSPVRALQRRIQGVRCLRAFVLVCSFVVLRWFCMGMDRGGSRWIAVDRGGSRWRWVSLLRCLVAVVPSLGACHTALRDKHDRAQGQRFRIPAAPKLNKDERDPSSRDRERCWRMPTPPINTWRRIHQCTRALICVLLLQEGKQKAKFHVEVCMRVCNIYTICIIYIT